MAWFDKLKEKFSGRPTRVSWIATESTRDRIAGRSPEYFANTFELELVTARKTLSDHKKHHDSYTSKSFFCQTAINRYFSAFLAAYSGGQPLEKVSEVLEELVEADEYGNPFVRLTSQEDILDVRPDPQIPLGILAYGLLAGVNANTLRRVIALGTPAGVCGLYDRLATHIEPRRLGEISPWKRYQPLIAAIDLPADGPKKTLTQRKALKAYVHAWYNNHREYGWFDSHKRDDMLFTGYWSFESAAIAALCDMDDSLCRDSPVYPGDLVASYREREGRLVAANARIAHVYGIGEE